MLAHKGTQALTTFRLELRAYLDSDCDMMYANWASDPEVTKYLTWNTHTDIQATRAVVAEWTQTYASPTVYHWGITLKSELIGDIAVVRWSEDHEWCELGYCLCRRYWGKGIMTEALSAVIRYLFDEIGFHRVQLRHDNLNMASGRVMQKAGLRYEGAMKEACRRKDGTWADIILYGLINE
jgi:[ribosomal protein S5]-alanine N-acetyltransferase